MIPPRARGLLLIAVAAVATVAGCGTEGVEVSDNDPDYEGAQLFAERCSGCHTLSAAGTQGTANRSQRVQGPDLDQRTETVEDVIYAIRNGGFSGAIMPQNIVVGEDAEKVAAFVAKYAGRDVTSSPARAHRRRGRATLDLKEIRRDPEPARSALARRGAAQQLDEVLALDERRRELTSGSTRSAPSRTRSRPRSRRRRARARRMTPR